MKNIIIHYVSLIVPFAIIVLGGNQRFGIDIPSILLIMLYLAWCFLYAPFLIGRRLYLKGGISKPRLVYKLNWEQFKMVNFSK